jgi:hypothetical protein
LELIDKTTKEADLEPLLRNPVLELIRKGPTLFRAVKVDPQLGTIAWNLGAAGAFDEYLMAASTLRAPGNTLGSALAVWR